MIAFRQATSWSPALTEHIRRVATEDASERFTLGVDWGSVARRYRDGLSLEDGAPGWTRLWIAYDFDQEGRVIAHASLLDLDGDICNGHISVESPHRGGPVAKELQRMRFDWLDRHLMSLLGPVAPGNERSMRGCLRAGFRLSYYDEHTGASWMVREPRGG